MSQKKAKREDKIEKYIRKTIFGNVFLLVKARDPFATKTAEDALVAWHVYV